MSTKNELIELPRLLTTGTISRVCGVAARTAAKWIDTPNMLHGFRIPGSMDRRVHRNDLLQFIRDHFDVEDVESFLKDAGYRMPEKDA